MLLHKHPAVTHLWGSKQEIQLERQTRKQADSEKKLETKKEKERWQERY